jgi:catechol 2,3-dioxygenase-like lactoylglutathione lyase family enzyme
MLTDCEVIAFTQTIQPERAKAFYRDVLGLKFDQESVFALVFTAGRTMLRVQKVRELSPLPFTALGWRVPDIAAAVQELSKRGVAFERYTGMSQDDAGIWTTPDGGKVCWFKDPDGNVLSLTQFPRK